MHPMKDYLLKNTKVGQKVRIFLNNNKEIVGEILSLDDDSCVLKTDDLPRRPVNYNIIGDVEVQKTVEAAVPIDQNNHKDIEDTSAKNDKPISENEIENIISMYADFKCPPRDLLKDTQIPGPLKIECFALLDSFDAAKKVHELDPRYNRISRIINRLGELIKENKNSVELLNFLCSITIELTSFFQTYYIDSINTILLGSIDKISCDDPLFCKLLGKIAVLSKNYAVIHKLANDKNNKGNHNIIKLLIFLLYSDKKEPSLLNKENIYDENNFNHLLAQFNELPPGKTLPNKIPPVAREIETKKRPDIKVGIVGGRTHLPTFEDTSQPHKGVYTGFIDQEVGGFWVILALDGNTYPFWARNVEDADVFKILKTPETWENQSVKFYIEKGDKGFYAKRVQLGKIINPRPFIRRAFYNKQPENQNITKQHQLPEIPELTEARRQYTHEKNYQRALKLFEAGIEKAKKSNNIPVIAGSLQNMIEIYFRIGPEQNQYENCIKAESILTSHKSYFQKSGYYTILIQICEKLYKLGFEEKLLNALDEAINEMKTEKTSLHFILRKAYILQQKADANYNVIVDVLNQWVTIAKNLENSGFITDLEKLRTQRKTVLVMAAGYISKIKSLMDNYIVPSPLKEAIEKSSEAMRIMNEAPKEDEGSGELSIDQSWNILFDEASYRISPFVKMKLDECNLTGKIPINKLNNEGKYIGTVKDAIQEYQKVADSKRGSTLKPVERYEGYLIAARMIYDSLLNKDILINVDERQNAMKLLFSSIGKSFVSFGDYAVKNHELSLDTARFYYFQGLKYIIDEGRGQDKQNAATRLNLSFFLGRNEIPLPTYDQATYKALSYSKEFPQLMEMAEINDDQITELINFILQMLSDEIFTQEEYLDWLIEPIFRSKIGKMFIKGLNEKIGNLQIIIQGSLSKQDIHQILDKLKNKYIKEKSSFVSSLKKYREFSFSPSWLEEIKKINDILNKHKFKNDMIKCDIEYLHIINQWVARAFEYNANNDIETKAEIIRFIIDGTDSLTQKILTVPSKLSFENLYVLIPRFRDVAEKEYANLCENNPPEIIIELSGEKEHRSNDGKVFLQINVRNMHGKMTADSLTVYVEKGEGFSVIEQDSSSIYLRGGESNLYKTELRLEENSLTLLTPKIIVNYTRKTSIDKEIKEEKTAILAVQLTDEEFETIDNPYSKYAGGNVVDDEKMFFGRKEFIDGIISHLIDSDGEFVKKMCILLYGQKRTGKSSILMHLNRRIRDASKDTIIVDLGDISVFGNENLSTYFSRSFCKNLKYALENDHRELVGIMKERNISIPEIDFKMSFSEANARLNDFLIDFNYFLESKPLGRKHNIVVMIDEFTAIYGWIQQKKMDDDFMLFWKGFVNNNKLVGILVGKDTMPDFIKKYPNPFGAIKEEPVTYLPEPESERMIVDPPAKTKLLFTGDAGKKAIKRIQELTAGSAFFNMILLDRLVEYMNEERRRYVSDADVNTLCRKKIFSGINPMKLSNFEALYDDGDLSDEFRKTHNLSVLYGIAKSGSYNGNCKQNEIKIDKDLEDGNLNNKRIDFLIEKLIARGVLERDKNENLRIEVGLFYEWLTQYCSPKTIKDVK